MNRTLSSNDRWLMTAILATTLAAGGCMTGVTGGGNNDVDGDVGGDPTMRSVALKFAAQVGDDQALCDVMYEGLGTSNQTAEILDLRFYVSNIRLVNDAGEEVELALDQDGQWQVENVALLDFEDATGGCNDLGTDDINTVVTGVVPPGDYVGVRFDLGVPFDLNHEDVTAAPSPLNLSAMYWAWAIGHKFLRVDVQTAEGMRWNIHLGSTMCESDGPQDPPVAACARPNLPALAFDLADIDTDTIVLDIAALVSDADLTEDTEDTASGCQSFPDDLNECDHIYPMLGMDFATGRCINDCASQQIFRIESGESRGGAELAAQQITVSGGMFSCADCHGADGSGGAGPDLRPSPADHLMGHAQGDLPHPDGVKFPQMTQTDFNDLAAFLNSLCSEDDSCEPLDEEMHHHDEGDEHADGEEHAEGDEHNEAEDHSEHTGDGGGEEDHSEHT